MSEPIKLSYHPARSGDQRQSGRDDIMVFAWKIEYFDKLQLPQSLIFFAEILRTFST